MSTEQSKYRTLFQLSPAARPRTGLWATTPQSAIWCCPDFDCKKRTIAQGLQYRFRKSNCPEYIMRFRTNYFDAVSFCASIGAKVVEPRTQDDFKEVGGIGRQNLCQFWNSEFLNELWSTAKSLFGQWSDGPWLGFIAPFQDSNRVVPQSTLIELDNKAIVDRKKRCRPL